MRKLEPWPMPLQSVATLMLWLSLIFLLSGCGKPPLPVEKYILEYSSPEIGARPQLDQSLTVAQFAVAQAFNTSDMVYRPSPYQSEVYRYHRWRVNPGYLVTDYLIRDLRILPAVPGGLSGPQLREQPLSVGRGGGRFRGSR